MWIHVVAAAAALTVAFDLLVVLLLGSLPSSGNNDLQRR
jgi:hypothetical protein